MEKRLERRLEPADVTAFESINGWLVTVLEYLSEKNKYIAR